MIANLIPYSAYGPSGVPWLGDVPEHWEVRRLKTLCSRSALYGANIAAASYTPTGVRFLRTTDITEDGRLKGGGVFLPEESVRDYLLADGDVLISRSGTIGRSFLYDPRAHGPCAYAGYLVRFVPVSEILSKYIFLFTKTQAFARFLRVMAISSTIENVNGEKYANLSLPLPPLLEQAAIVRYLDHADRRIQRYIGAKQKLITLLEEQKQAIIHRAVTRGLDPDVRLKPSGVEWLGEVPEHWNLVPLKWVSHRSQNGATPPTSESLFYEDGAIPWYGPSSCGTKEEIGAPVRHLNEVAFSKGHARLVRGPALLIVVIGATAGRMALMLDDGSTNQQITAFELSRDLVSPEFILRQLRSAESWLRATASTATIPILDSGVVARLLCAIPPMEEQDVINRALDSHVSRIDSVIVRHLTGINLFREYRTRLIADVVTGKLDVRGAAAQLPDEAEEPEPMEENGEWSEQADDDIELSEALH